MQRQVLCNWGCITYWGGGEVWRKRKRSHTSYANFLKADISKKKSQKPGYYSGCFMTLEQKCNTSLDTNEESLESGMIGPGNQNVIGR